MGQRAILKRVESHGETKEVILPEFIIQIKLKLVGGKRLSRIFCKGLNAPN
jgi:hypothetical protein